MTDATSAEVTVRLFAAALTAAGFVDERPAPVCFIDHTGQVELA